MARAYPTRTMTMRLRGRGEAVRGAHARLAELGYDQARKLGLDATIEVSRCTESRSRYLTVRAPDGAGDFLIRISDHARPKGSGQANPHIDLISQDGVGGSRYLMAVIERIAAGEIAWFDAGKARRRRR